MQALTPAEMLKVLKVASASKRNHAMILCAFRFGMRASEVCGLRLSDIDMKDGAITIRRLKGSRTSVFALANVQGQPLLSVARVLNAWLEERKTRQDASDFVFVSQKGGKLDRSAFFRMFQAVATEAGMPPEKRHPHCCKHSLGFAMVSANRSLTTVQNALGHRSVASTGIYAQPSREQVDHAVQATLLELF
ncbi:MAG: tyrosine-type recombinase/integrase [Candidatus Acidiferrales bacterium]